MPIYEAVCSECGTVAARSKDVPEKDYYKLFLMVQKNNCPNCNNGMKREGDTVRFPYKLRVAKDPNALLPGVRRLPV